MIIFQKADRNKYHEYKDELKRLYLNTFTKGLSAQHISEQEATDYLNNIFNQGYGIFVFDNDKLIASLLSTPLSFDKECPNHLQKDYNQDSEYIAEVLVEENYRGQGLGKKLMQAYENHLNKQIKHVLLRVWDKNTAAVTLYQKAGFEVCGTMTQTKLKPISKEPFEMKKIYMIKSYQD